MAKRFSQRFLERTDMANFHICLRPTRAADYYLYAVSGAFIPGTIDFLSFGRILQDESSDAPHASKTGF
jgi:hypothetical protein